MRIAYYALHYGKEYLAYSIRSIQDAVDEIHILYTAKPSFGHGTDAVNPDTLVELEREAMRFATKPIIWHPGTWAQEGQHRDTIIEIAKQRGATVIATVDADELSKMSRDGRILNCVVEGPYDVYIAVDRKLADEKGVQGGEVPGQVDIMVFPDLDAANPVYKSITYFAEGMKSAALVAGAVVPVILPSRTDPPQTKAYSIALASFIKDQKKVAA